MRRPLLKLVENSLHASAGLNRHFGTSHFEVIVARTIEIVWRSQASRLFSLIEATLITVKCAV